MSSFSLIEIEKNETESFPDLKMLDLDRETEFRIYEFSRDQYGNKSSRLIMSTPDMLYAKKFLRSCRLTEGILIDDM